VKLHDQVGDILRRELVDAGIADHWEGSAGRCSVLAPRRFGDVNPRREPPLGRDRERRLRRFGFEQREVGDAARSELAADPHLAGCRLPQRLGRFTEAAQPAQSFVAEERDSAALRDRNEGSSSGRGLSLPERFALTRY
jgi:hypothetical protein